MELEQFIDFIGKEFDFDTTGIKGDTTFDEIGFDELDMIDLVMSVEDEYHTEVPDEALSQIKSIEDFKNFLDDNL